MTEHRGVATCDPISVLLLLVIVGQRIDAIPCENGPPQTLMIKEESVSVGSSLFPLDTNSGELWIFISDFPPGYFSVQTNGTNSSVVLLKPLDLETLYQSHTREDIELKLICGGTVPYTTKVILLGVNEHSPYFIGAPFTLAVNENSSPVTPVFDLSNKAGDADYNPDYTNDISGFRVVPYDGTEVDASSYFYMSDQTTGIVAVKVLFSYKDLALSGSTNQILNLSVEDYGGLQGFAVLNITILDVDDQAPAWVYDGCTEDKYGFCTVSPIFVADVTGNITGVVYVQPYPIKAVDKDTLNKPIEFIIYSGDDSHYFAIDNNGTVSQVKTINTAATSSFHLVLQASKIGSSMSSIYASLDITVAEISTAGPNTPDQTPAIKPTNGASDNQTTGDSTSDLSTGHSNSDQTTVTGASSISHTTDGGTSDQSNVTKTTTGASLNQTTDDATPDLITDRIAAGKTTEHSNTDQSIATTEPVRVTNVSLWSQVGFIAALSVLFVLVAVVVIVVIILVCWRRKWKTQVSPLISKEEGKPSDTSDDNSSQSSSDASPRLINKTNSNGISEQQRNMLNNTFQATEGKAHFLNSPSHERGQQLPKITAESQTDGGKLARKSRQRNRRRKNAEPESYDGTLEDENNVDFYMDPNKTKWSRNRKSYDFKTDPEHWMKVKNDY